MTATEPVRLASVGLGWWGGELAAAAERSGLGTVVRCFARTPAARAAFAERFGCRTAASFEEVLDDPAVEGVLLATPHSTHAQMIVAAAEAGKHVLVEKPLTLTVAEARRAIAVAERAGVVLQVGHHRRRLAATRALQRLVADGALGHVHLLEATFSVPSSLEPKPGWREQPAERPLGGMTPLGVHMVDSMHFLVGPIARVSVFSRRLLGRSNLDDVTTCLLEFAAGPLGTLSTSLVVPNVATLAAYGTNGAAWSEEDGARLHRQALGERTRTEQPVEAVDALAEQAAEFSAAIRGAARPEVGGPEALAVVAVLEACMVSVREQRPVEVAEVLARRD